MDKRRRRMVTKKMKVENRFWKKVNKTFNPNDCWIWMACTTRNKDGYGDFRVNGETVRAHRFAYELSNKVILVSPRIQVLHTCDNPPCCNPNHLFIGNQLDNMSDKSSKNRQYSKLNVKAIRLIKMLRSKYDYSLCKLGELFGVSFSLVGMIIRGEIWRQVK